MKNFIVLTLFTFALFFQLIAQPPCLPTAGGIPAGNDAPGCTLCGPIYQGTTLGYSPSAPGSAGFPCGTIENNQFISIIADATTTLQATILASDCLQNQGVQLIVYDQSFNPVSNCFSSGGSNLPGNVIASGLTPGQTYWIMIDGFAGDICDILVTTSGGVNTGPPDPPGPMTIDPDTTPLCPGAVVCYSISPVKGASEYQWIIPGNGNLVSGGGPNDLQVCVEYTAPGGGVVRVTPSNPCFPGIPVIEPVVVLPILPTLLPPEFVCVDDFPILRDGNFFTDPGAHEVIYRTGLGCDSVVTYVFVPLPQIPNVVDVNICAGGCFWVGNTCYDQPVTTPIRVELSAPYNQANGCDSIVIFTLEFDSTTTATSDFTVDHGACVNDILTVEYTGIASPNATFNWDFGNATLISGTNRGPFEISYSNAGDYNVSLLIDETSCSTSRNLQHITVADTIFSPQIECDPTTGFITFSWDQVPGADSFEVEILTGQSGNRNGLEYTLDGLNPSEEVTIAVTAISTSGCGMAADTLTCFANDCAPTTVNIDPIGPFCQDGTNQNVTLSATAGDNSGTFSFSGLGVSQPNIFNPNDASVPLGTNIITATYQVGTCVYTGSISAQIFQQPTASFTSPTEICFDQNLPINYTGDLGNLTWTLDGGTIVSNSGQRDWEVSFPASGDFEIGVTAEVNGCTSIPAVQVISVENQLAAPVLSCNSTASTINFSWDEIIGANTYEVTVLSGATGTLNGRNYDVTGLAPGDEVEIEVRAVSALGCEGISTKITCQTPVCPMVDLNIDPLNNICAGTQNIVLTANPTGGAGGGTFIWSGIGIQGNLLDVSGLTGTQTLSLEYQEGTCVYAESITYEITDAPTLSHEILSPIWYPGTIGSIDLTVTDGKPPYSYLWSNGATTEDLINVNRAFTYCVTVTDDNGCEKSECFGEIGEGTFRINPIITVCQNTDKRLSVRPSRGATFSWSPATDLSCDDCASPVINTIGARFYNITATLANGRSETRRIFVLAVPQAFCNSPRAMSQLEEELSISALDFENSNDSDFLKLEKEITTNFIKNEVSIAPNPTTGKVNISSIFDIENVEVFDLSGKMILNQPNIEKSSDSTPQIDLSTFAKGIYFLKINTGGTVILKRVVLI